MFLRQLEIRNLRVLRDVSVEPAPDLSLVVGPNGSGKTSLLEAIHLLGTGRSFRTRRAEELVTRGKDSFQVYGELADGAGATHGVGIERGVDGTTRIRLSGRDVRVASRLARELPLILITPESQRLLSDGANLRRRVIDWMMFHVEPSYLDLFQRYRRALRQRNAALRGETPGDDLGVWDVELGTLGEQLHGMRERHLKEVLEAVGGTVRGLLGFAVDVSYRPGWDRARPLAESLSRSAGADRGRGFTGLGPHRADLRFSVEGRSAQGVLSRGESKLFVVAVSLAQLAYLRDRLGRTPLILVDDLASELDAGSRSRFLQMVRETGAQTYVTAVSEDLVPAREWASRRTFHVEQGGVVKMV